MKKIIITSLIFIISMSSFVTTHANNGTCKIKDWTIEEILEYIDSNRIVVKNIVNEAISWAPEEEKSLKNNLEKNFKQIKWPITRIYNEAFSFDWYYSYFKYYAVYPISNEVPYEIKRDYKIIEAEAEWLKKIISTVSQKWVWDIKIDNACENVSSDVKCNIKENIRVEELLWKLVKNNTRILDLYRNVVIWEKTQDYNDLFLVWDNFVNAISTYYNPSSASTCSKEGGFFERIAESIEKIWQLNKEWKDWVQKWKDAVNLLLQKDMSNEEYQKIEKELLKKELSRQWVYWDSQKNMLDALDKYNKNNWFSLDNNFVYNTFNNSWNKLEKEFTEFKEEVIWDFFEDKQQEKIEIWNINVAEKNSNITAEVEYRVKSTKEQLENFESISEYETKNIITRLLDIHDEISTSSEVLTESCEYAIRVCKKQDPSRWNCWTCN